MAPVTSWTDNDSNGVPMDWTNPNPSDPMYLRAIVAAINERKLAIGSSMISDLALTGRYYNLSVLQSLDSTVKGMVASFVNHTDSGGDWTGKDTIPNFSFSSIMQATGLSEATGFTPNLYYNSDKIKAWFIQTHKLLNLMRWRSKALARYKLKDPEPFGTFSDAVNDFITLDWIYGSSSYFAFHFTRYISTGYQIGRNSAYANITYGGDFLPSYDLYAAFFTNFDFGANTLIKENNDYIANDDNLLYNVETGTISETGQNIYLGYFDTVTCLEPEYNTARAWIATKASAILKFDGADGFKFRGEDW